MTRIALFYVSRYTSQHVSINYPDSKVHGANMGPIWGRQDPGGPQLCYLGSWACIAVEFRLLDKMQESATINPFWETLFEHLTVKTTQCFQKGVGYW